MKITEKQVVEKQKKGFNIDDKGYIKSMNPKDNILSTITNWNDIELDLKNGSGGELKKDGNNRMKFCALHSSSALCVNNFASFKEHKDKISFCGYSNFKKSVFEQKLPTGISTPNLDFYLENNDMIIGVESKFTECLTESLQHTKENLCKYFMRKELDYLPRLFDGLILHYMNCPDKMYLDVAQLIKYSIGLKKNKTNKKALLVYV